MRKIVLSIDNTDHLCLVPDVVSDNLFDYIDDFYNYVDSFKMESTNLLIMK